MIIFRSFLEIDGHCMGMSSINIQPNMSFWVVYEKESHRTETRV